MTRLRMLLTTWLCTTICHTLFAAPPDVKPEDLPRTEPTSAEKAVGTFDVRPGFRLELMAAEPLVVDPVAFAFDEDSRAYVVEMRDYSEHREEKLGRVKLLHDDNGDGRYDRATIFAAGFAWPTGVVCWDGGVFLAATPDLLYLKDTDGDGQADVRAIVFQGFGNLVEKLNVQALPNSLQWGPDQCLHLALGGNASKLANFSNQHQPIVELRSRDLSFDPRKLDLRSEPGGGQWGMTFDNLGRKFICSNSRHIQQSIFPEYALRLNNSLSPAAVDIAEDGPQAEVFRKSPVEPWRILRTQWRVAGVVPGPIEGGGRASGYFTSACGITIYGGDAYPADYVGNAFIADCGSNLIHRKTLHGEVRRTARRAADEQTREFVASQDNWFRPVALANAPDGCLWVCDMYREIVEHPWSIPEPIKSKVNLDAGNDRGRLWRIVPTDFKPRPSLKLSTATTAELVAILAHNNRWHRDTAARLLHQRHDLNAVPALEKLLREATQPVGRLTALRVLIGLVPAEKMPWQVALADGDPLVRAEALSQIGFAFATGTIPAELRLAIEKLATDPSAEVRFRVGLLLPHWAAAERPSVLLSLAKGDVSSSDLRHILATSAGDATANLWRQAAGSNDAEHQRFARELVGNLGQRAQPAEIAAVIATLANHPQRGAQLQALADGLRQAKKSLRELAAGESLDSLATVAIATLRQPNQTAAERTQALQVLGLTGKPDSAAVIAETITPQLSRPEATAAIDALDRLQPADLGKQFVNLWPKLPAAARPDLIQTWRSRKTLVSDLLAAVEANTIPASEISATDVAALRGFLDPEIQPRVEKIFGPLSSRESAVAAYRGVLELKGSAAAGAAIFHAKCHTCHRKQGEGTAVGPDMDAAAAAGKEKLLTNILDPSREITAGYIAGIVTTSAGEVISGIIAAEANGGVTLKIPSKPPRTFARDEIEQFKRLSKSLMPEGIETGLTPQDVANVLEFLVAPAAVAAGPRLPLTHYRTAEGKVETIHTTAHWQQRRDDILAKMQEIMGPFPGKERRVPLEPKIEEETDCGTYIRRLVTYTSEPGNRVPAYLLIPKKHLEPNAPKSAAILCLHPTDNNIGHKVVVGLGGKANRQYAAELAERGFVTLAPSYPLLANYQPDLDKLGYVSGTMKAIWDNSRGLDYLESLPFVAPRFAAIGHSLGGHNSVYTAVFDERIAAVVSSCGLDSYQDYMRGNITGWTSTRYMPRLAAFKGRAHEVPFDFDELLAAIAPRGVSIVAPLKDDNFRAESVDRIAANAGLIFKLYDKPQQLVVEHPDCGHDFPDAARERAYKFLAEHLEAK